MTTICSALLHAKLLGAFLLPLRLDLLDLWLVPLEAVSQSHRLLPARTNWLLFSAPLICSATMTAMTSLDLPSRNQRLRRHLLHR
jgi:hypothetical protein